MANKAIVADHLLTSFFVHRNPPHFPRQQKTAARAGTLDSGPIDSLAAYQHTFYSLSESPARANRVGGAA